MNIRGAGFRRPAAALAAVLAVLYLPGCGAKTNEAARAAGIVPPNAILFMSVSLDPSIEQKKNLLTIAARFPKARDKIKKDFDDTREGLLDEALEPACLDYEKDVKPWLGSEVAVAILPQTTSEETETEVLLVRVKDEEKARTTLEQSFTTECPTLVREHRDFRIVDDFAVIAAEDTAEANKEALDAITATAAAEDGGLAKSKDFVRLVDQLHGDRLLVGYTDGKRALESTDEEGQLDSGDCDVIGALSSTGKAAFDIHAGSSSLVLEAVGDESAAPLKSGDPKITEGLPANTTGSLTLFDVSSIVRMALNCTGQEAEVTGELADQSGLDLDLDVLSWMRGEAVLVSGPFVEGRTFPDFGLVVQTTDHDAAAKAIDKLKVKLSEDGEGLTEFDVNGVKGITVAEPVDEGIQPAAVLLADRLILATSPAYARQLAGPSTPPLGTTKLYTSTIGEASATATQMQLVVDLKAIKDAVVANLSPDDLANYQRDVAPQLDPLDSLGLKISTKDGLSYVTARVTFR